MKEGGLETFHKSSLILIFVIGVCITIEIDEWMDEWIDG